ERRSLRRSDLRHVRVGGGRSAGERLQGARPRNGRDLDAPPRLAQIPGCGRDRPWRRDVLISGLQLRLLQGRLGKTEIGSIRARPWQDLADSPVAGDGRLSERRGDSEGEVRAKEGDERHSDDYLFQAHLPTSWSRRS